MVTETLSGSITLKRLKKGLNVVMSIETENAPMYQGFNPSTGVPMPDFTKAANQPILVPKAMAGNGETANITNGAWYYNNTPLSIGQKDAGNGFYKCGDERFAFNPTNYKLRIIGNIASKDNTSNDIFRFDCAGEVHNTPYESQATIELHLQMIGTSAAALTISGSSVLRSFDTSIPLTAHLSISGEFVDTGYNFQWKTEDGKVVKDSADKVFNVKHEHITGIGGIYCSAYLASDTSKTVIATDFHKIVDYSDEYELTASVDKDWDGTSSQQVTATLYKLKDGQEGEEITMNKDKVTHVLVSSVNNTPIATKKGNPITVGDTEWGKIKNDNEDIIDFISYEV